MKKLLAVIMAALICASAFAGCSKQNNDNSDNTAVSDTQNSDSNDANAVAEGEGESGSSWSDVEKSFNDAQKAAENEISSEPVSTEDFINMVVQIDGACTGLEYLSQEEINQKLAEAYKAACKLEIIASKSNSDEGRELAELAKNAKEFLKGYYEGSGIGFAAAQEKLKKSGERLAALSPEDVELYLNDLYSAV